MEINAMSLSDHHTDRPQCRQQRPSSANLAFKGKLFEVWQWNQTLFDGSTARFETLRRPDTVLVIPILSNGDIIFAEEKQAGMSPLLHAVGGRIEPGESPEEAARRELLEESGYVAEEWSIWDAWQPVMKIDWAVYLFVARQLSVASAQHLDSGEKIRLRFISARQLLDRESDLELDDYELLYKLYQARSSDSERQRVAKLFGI
jgi:ADP-ribose pyrophosphatase